MSTRPGHLDDLTPMSWALAPLSWVYALGWQSYLAVYRLGFKKPIEAHPRVICIGNLMVGGTGKTPFVRYVTGLLQARDVEVVISASGYGSPRAEGATLAPSGPLDPSVWGDEPALLRQAIPEVPIVVGRQRVRAAQLAFEAFPKSVLVLDDGFQHLPLRKQLSIVLDPIARNQFCLPAGPYRESKSGLARANLAYPRDGALSTTFVLQSCSQPDHTTREVDVLCAIARPQRVLDSLAGEGFAVVRAELRPDHDNLQGDLGDFGKVRPLVITLKDWVKLGRRQDLEGRCIWVADTEVALAPGAEHFLVERLMQVAGGG